MAGILDWITEKAKAQYAKGAPYREAVGGLLQGDMNKVNQALSKSDLTPMDFATTFAPLGITAWHGSPHTFEKFDLSKMGTGEGAQQYGWGAYLAEHPDVAKIYTPRDLKYEDKLLNLYNQAERVGNYPAMQVYEDLMIQKMPSEISLEGLVGKDLLQAKSALNQGTKLYQSQKGSNIYKVDLADESLSRMLNWDKPISEQSREVQTAISPIVKTYGLPSSEKGSSVYQAANEIFGNEKKLIQQRDNLFNKYQKEGMSFSDAVKAMNPADRASFSNIADKIGNLNKNQEMSSKYLQKRGVTGIKYLDQLSRDTGNGTSNYVVFNPETIKILERNGLLFP